MYYGKNTSELDRLRNQYNDLFGYDPNGDMELEFDDHDDYVSVLRTCIETKEDIFEVLKGRTGED